MQRIVLGGGMSLLVSELFASIQGESSYAGYPCAFVRLSGCNLNCAWCDTAYARSGGEGMEIAQIVDRVLDLGLPLVEITGGEPLLQEETPLLAGSLLAQGLIVLLETNGSMDISRIDPEVVTIMDVKCPSSGEAGTLDRTNLERLRPHDELKFVIGDTTDYAYARSVLDNLPAPGPVHFSPIFGMLHPSELAGWIVADRLPVRLNLQLHKYIWSPDMRGV